MLVSLHNTGYIKGDNVVKALLFCNQLNIRFSNEWKKLSKELINPILEYEFRLKCVLNAGTLMKISVEDYGEKVTSVVQTIRDSADLLEKV